MSRRGTFYNENGLAKHAFDNYSFQPPPAEIIHNCHELVEYLEKAHSICLSNDYIERLNKPKRKCRTSTFSISRKAIDAVITACNLWKEYIDEDISHLLVCQEIFSMVTIHSSVISARNFEELYGIAFKRKPSHSFVTIVNKFGDIKVYP